MTYSNNYIIICLGFVGRNSGSVSWAIFCATWYRLRSLRGTQLVGGWARGSKTASTTCQVPRRFCKAGLRGGLSAATLTRGFSSKNVSGWSDMLWWLREPRKRSKKIEVFSFPNLGREIGTASLFVKAVTELT